MTHELRTVREAQAADPSPRRLRSGLNAMNVRMFVHPGSGARAVLEAPVYRTFPRARMDLLRYRAVAYDRLVGDIVPSVVPFGYLGVVEDGDPVLLTDRAAGPPVPRGARGWVFAHAEDDGRVAVDSCRAAGADRTRWGTSTRSLLGLRPGPLEGARLWSLGDRAVWLRQEHGHRRTVPLRRDDAEPWPRALVEDLFFSALCTLMLDDSPVPGLPPGAVVHLDAGESLIVGLAATPEELAAFLREDHVAHHLLAPAGAQAPPRVSTVGDLPRGSVANRVLDGRSTPVYTERLADRTTSYAVEDGSIIAVVDDGVDHYTGVPGRSGAWVERGRPRLLRWEGGSWEADGVIESLRPGGGAGGVVVITAAGPAAVPLAEAPPGPEPDPDSDPAADASRPRDRVLWCPTADDPVSGRSAFTATRVLSGHVVELVLTESVLGAVPLVWFDSSRTLPIQLIGLAGVDLGSRVPGGVEWCHAASRPVVRVGIDYEALSHADVEGLLAQLHRAWNTALDVIAEELPESSAAPFLGGHSFGAALAAVAVLRRAASPTGVLLRSGAYDRYTTPGGFEHDNRTVASAPDLYGAMTVLPQAHAHRGIPFLITCGDSDENSATTPQQSLTLYENLVLCGADAALAVFPGEGHSFESRRAILERRDIEDEWMRSRSPRHSADSTQTEGTRS